MTAPQPRFPQGPAAEATASLLIAFCHSHDDSAGLWDQILAAASAATAAAPTAAHLKARPSKPPQLDGDSPRMQRTLLLLRHCADSLTEQVGDTGAAASGIGSPAAPAEPQAWPSPALDALAVQLAEERASLSASGAAAAVLATALGANGAGVVLLQRPAADRVLGILAARLTAAVGVSCEANHDDGGEAADVPVGQAVAALQPLLCNSRCGAWRQLPERMCECVAVVAQLAWRAAPAAATTSSVAARSAAAAAVGWGPSWSRHAGLGPRADGAHEVDGDGEGAYDSGDEEAGGDGATGRADVVLHYASDEGEDDGDDGELAGGARGGAAAAARCWADGAPLGAAAKALSPARAAALAMHLAALLAAAVPGGKESAAPEVGFPPLGPRAWAVHSARLLRVVPGGWQRRQAALAVLLSGRADWSTWSAFATGRTGEAAPATAGSSGSQAAAAAVPTATATLEYLARLVEGVGPEAALGLGGGEVEEEEGAEGTVGTGGSGAPAAGKAGLRSWLLVELLAGRQAAEASGLRAEETDDDEDDEDEEEDEDEEGSAGPRYGHRHRGSRAWLRVVQRVGDALLEHVVYGNMDGLDEQYGGGRTPYGDLLHAVVDELAEGCRCVGEWARGACILTGQDEAKALLGYLNWCTPMPGRNTTGSHPTPHPHQGPVWLPTGHRSLCVDDPHPRLQGRRGCVRGCFPRSPVASLCRGATPAPGGAAGAHGSAVLQGHTRAARRAGMRRPVLGAPRAVPAPRLASAQRQTAPPMLSTPARQLRTMVKRAP